MKVFQKESNNSKSGGSGTASVIMDVIPLVMGRIRVEMRSRRTPGLSILQFRALIYLFRHENVSLSQLAEYIGLQLPSTSKLIDALVERKLVVRRESMVDRRRMCLKLSTTGLAELKRTRQSAETRLAGLLAVLTPEQQSGISASLTTLRSLFASQNIPEENTGYKGSGGANG